MHVHVAERSDVLAEELACLLAVPFADPFAEELVVVPAKGVERWLTQRLSHRLGIGERGGDGVCAGVRFVSPRSLVALLTGVERDDPWDPDRLVWPLLSVIDASMGEPWCATLATHLGFGLVGEDGDLRRDRRYSVARRLAGLFASYAVQRPSLVEDWAHGRDLDGAGAALAGDLAWQPELWRRVVRLVAAAPPQVRHRDTVAAIRGGAVLALPDRLSLFGHTRLPVTEIDLVRAVAEHREVHLYLPQASPVSWDRLTAVSAPGPVRRREDRSALAVYHPLLSSLGRDSRELQRSLAALGGARPATTSDQPAAATLLGWLQADLRADREPVAKVRAARFVADDDRSVQVHACHGAARQVEVLREVLVGLLADDTTLEPRDILVMCPDIDAYAPLFQACFGLGTSIAGGHPAHGLRLQLADRGLASTNPLIAVAVSLLLVTGGRATATEVLDLAAAAPVRHRFRFGADDLATLTSWVEQSGVRWGLNATLRSPYKLERFEQNTWRTGLDRLLLGVAMAEEGHRTLGATLPIDDVASAAVDLAGRLAEFVDRLESCIEALRGSSTLSDWVVNVDAGVRALCSVAAPDAWQLAQFERELAGLVDAGRPADGGRGAPLRLADVRAMLQARTSGRPTRANFRTGALTVCTMVPMRSVPHRVVALVGLGRRRIPADAHAGRRRRPGPRPVHRRARPPQ